MFVKMSDKEEVSKKEQLSEKLIMLLITTLYQHRVDGVGKAGTDVE